MLLRPSDNAVVVDDEDDDLVIVVVVVVVVVVNNDDLDLEDAPPRGMISYSAGFFVRIMSLLMMSHDLEAAAKEEAARTTVFWGQKTENETRTSAAARRLNLMVMVFDFWLFWLHMGKKRRVRREAAALRAAICLHVANIHRATTGTYEDDSQTIQQICYTWNVEFKQQADTLLLYDISYAASHRDTTHFAYCG